MNMLATIHLNDRETAAWAVCPHTRAVVTAYARLRATRAGRRYVQIVASDARILKVLEVA